MGAGLVDHRRSGPDGGADPRHRFRLRGRDGHPARQGPAPAHRLGGRGGSGSELHDRDRAGGGTELAVTAERGDHPQRDRRPGRELADPDGRRPHRDRGRPAAGDPRGGRRRGGRPRRSALPGGPRGQPGRHRRSRPRRGARSGDPAPDRGVERRRPGPDRRAALCRPPAARPADRPQQPDPRRDQAAAAARRPGGRRGHPHLAELPRAVPDGWIRTT